MLLLLGQASKGNVPRVALIACLALPCLACACVLALDVARFLAAFFSAVQCPTPRYAAADSATVVAATAGA